MPMEEYVAGMDRGLYGDNLAIAVLPQTFKRNISVVGPQSVRSYLANGGKADDGRGKRQTKRHGGGKSKGKGKVKPTTRLALRLAL